MYICVAYIFYRKKPVREYRRAIENEQSRETGSIGYTRQRKTKQKQLNTICVEHHYAQTNTNNVNKT